MINGKSLPKVRERSAEKVEFVVVDPMQTAAQLAHILLNLRHYTKIWDEHFGYDARAAKKRWEQKADEYLESIKKK